MAIDLFWNGARWTRVILPHLREACATGALVFRMITGPDAALSRAFGVGHSLAALGRPQVRSAAGRGLRLFSLFLPDPGRRPVGCPPIS